MRFTRLTPVDDFGGWYAKREDLAYWERPDWPSGAKVRQYTKMIKEQPGLPLLVGCSAFSAMQIYIAAACEKFGLEGIVYTPGRAKMSDATRYAISKGVEVNEVRPCPGPNVYRARASERAKTLGGYVHWNVPIALVDTKKQAENIPEDVRRVLIPTGSGLTAAGVLAGLAGRDVEVVAAAGSTMAAKASVLELARGMTDKKLPTFKLFRLPMKYEQFVIARLPDGTPLDPFYAAKILNRVRSGDCLWLTGLRPVESMPEKCRVEFADWHGPRK